MSSIEGKESVFDLAQAQKKITDIIKLKKSGQEEQLRLELADPVLPLIIDTLARWGNEEEKTQAALVEKLLQWENESERLENEEKEREIEKTFTSDKVLMWHEGLSAPRSSLPEVVRAVIVGNPLQTGNGGQRLERNVDPDLAKILAPELENSLSQLAEDPNATKGLSRENKYGNQSGEYVKNQDWLARQAVIESVLAWAETLRANENAHELSLALEYKPSIVELKIKIVEASAAKMTDKEEKKRLIDAVREVKNYVREFQLLTEKQKERYFRQTSEQDEQQVGEGISQQTDKKEEKKKKPKRAEKGNPFANLFRRKNGINNEETE